MQKSRSKVPVVHGRFSARPRASSADGAAVRARCSMLGERSSPGNGVDTTAKLGKPVTSPAAHFGDGYAPRRTDKALKNGLDALDIGFFRTVGRTSARRDRNSPIASLQCLSPASIVSQTSVDLDVRAELAPRRDLHPTATRRERGPYRWPSSRVSTRPAPASTASLIAREPAPAYSSSRTKGLGRCVREA